jgi:hypothetical protein
MKSTPNCRLQFLPLLVFSLLKAVATQESFNVTGFDIGPDWTKVTHFPPLTDDQGKPIDANNVRGTRLFGYEGCGKREENIINEAYKDFHTLTDQLVLWNNIGWKIQGAKEFWGATAGRAPIRDEQKVQIRREFSNIGYILRPKFLVTEISYAANQIYSTPRSWEPPWIPYLGRVLRVHVRCSGGDGTGDPHNICHDKNDPDDPGCPPFQKASPAGAALEAYTENTGKGEKLESILIILAQLSAAHSSIYLL